MTKLYNNSLISANGLNIANSVDLFSGLEFMSESSGSPSPVIGMPEDVSVRVITNAAGEPTGYVATWDEPLDVNGRDVSYEYAWIIGDATPVYTTTTGLTHTYSFTGDWTSVRFSIRAVTDDANSEYVIITSSGFTLPAIAIPRNVLVDVISAGASNTQFRVTWDSPNNLFGRTVEYEMEFNSFGTIVSSVDATSQTFTYTVALASFTHFTIKAVASDQTESAEVRVNATDFFRADLPLPVPTDVSVSITGRANSMLQFDIDWTAPSVTRTPSYQWRLNTNTAVDIEAGTTEASGNSGTTPVSEVEYIEVRSVVGSLTSDWVRVDYEDWSGYIEPIPQNVLVTEVQTNPPNSLFRVTWDHGRSQPPDHYEIAVDGSTYTRFGGENVQVNFSVRTDDISADHFIRLRAVRGTHVSQFIETHIVDWIRLGDGDGQSGEQPLNIVLVDSAGNALSDFYGNVLEAG